MQAEYTNEYGEIEACLLLANSVSGTMVLIELDGVRGWCSAHLVECEEY